MREAVDIEYILVANEHEALALENNLIKQRKPRFNILLRDDKTYPYVKLTLADRFPKVFVTRRLRKDGSAYYGPYFPGNLAYRVAELIHRSYLQPSCKGRSFALSSFARLPASTTFIAASARVSRASPPPTPTSKPSVMRSFFSRAATRSLSAPLPRA